jgi:hypothetical protein
MMRFHLAALACLVAFTMSIPAVAQDAQDDRRVARLQTTGGVIRTDTWTLRGGPVVANAPFSADATTTVTQMLGDGTKIEQKTTAKLYRDSTGRVRLEQTVIGLDRLNASAQPQTTITFDSVPGDPSPYTLDPVARTARRGARGVQWLTRDALNSTRTASYSAAVAGSPLGISTASGNLWIAPYFNTGVAAHLQPAAVPSDLKPTEEQLAARQIEGVKATGKRTTIVIPAGRLGNDRPISITDEQWESPELQLLVGSRFSDPRTGVVEYRLTNISRAEPRADLFAVPAGYTEAAATPGLRTGGPAAQPGQGGRGGRRGGGAQ